jgi:hypothetical protein
MRTLVIPGKYRATKALQARYIEGWQHGLAGHPPAYSTDEAADAFKREFGRAQLDAFCAGYDAGVNARPDYRDKPPKPAK